MQSAPNRVSLTDRAARLREVVAILHRYDLLPTSSSDPDTLPERVRDALLAIGPTGVKLGQFLAQRPDLVGTEIVEQLGSLHADVPPESHERTLETFRASVGATMDQAFVSVDDAPLACGSIGQVYAARLEDGRDVVVKVRRADARPRCRVDLTVLRDLARTGDFLGLDLGLDASEVVDRFAEALLAELDFRREAAHLRYFVDFFAADDDVDVPVVIDALSTDSVLTMTRLTGIPLTEDDAVRELDVDLSAVAHRGVGLFLRMIKAGRFHADPHAGNLFIRGDASIAIVDFGMVGYLDDSQRRHLLTAVDAFVEDDADTLARGLRRLCHAGEPVDMSALRRDVQALLERYGSVDLRDLPVQECLFDCMETLRTHRLALDGDLALLVRCMLLLDGTARQLDADLDLVRALRDAEGGVSPTLMGIDLLDDIPGIPAGVPRSLTSGVSSLLDVPADLETLLEVVSQGRLSVNVRLAGLDGAVHRLTWATVSAALLLGGCILLATTVPPAVWGISLFGVALLLLGCASSLMLLASIGWYHLQSGN